MSQLVLFGIVGLCWTALCVRMWSLPRGSGNRALASISWGMATLALSATVQITAVAQAVDSRAVPDTAGTLSNCLTLMALTCFQCSLVHMIHPPADAARRVRRPLWSCTTVVVAIIVLFGLFGSNYREVLAAASSSYQVPVISVSGYVYLVYLAVTMVTLAASSLTYATITDRFSLRVGMALLSLGLLTGLAYTFVRLAAMVTHQLGLRIAILHGDLIGDLFRGATVMTFVGIVFPVIGPRVGLDALVNRIRINRSRRALHPLWQALRQAFPSIVLDAPDANPQRALYRQIIEIWDGRLQLRPWFDPAAAERARDRGEAAVEATLIADALNRRSSGEPPSHGAADPTPPCPADTIADDLTWLTEVSKAFVRTGTRDAGTRTA